MMKPTEEKEEISESVRTVMKKFKRDMTHLEQAYQSYQAASSDQTPIPKDHFSLFIEWALHMHEYYDEDLHSGQVDQQVILNNKTCHKASSRDQFFKSFSPEFVNCLWPMRFTRKFLKKLGNVKTEKLQMDILDIMQSFGNGYFLNHTLVPVQGLSYMVFFKSRLPGCNLALVVSVHLERYPEFDKYKKVKAFQYLHVVRFLDILNENDKVTALNACISFLEDCRKDPARQDCQPKQKTMPIHQPVLQQTNWPCFEKRNCLRGDVVVLSSLISEQKKNNELLYTFLPNLFETDYLTPEEIEDLIYDKDIVRWVSKKAYSIFLRRQENAVISKINAEVLEKFADFESSARLVNLLEKMKNLKLKLTSEEKRLIGQNGNVLAIGRSGTGKTTCCVLRLFSQEMLYKIRLAQAQVKHGVLRDARYMADQLENLIGVHSVFVTASPVLTNEVHRYYQNLSRRIRDEIKEREEKHKEKEKVAEPSMLSETKGKEESEIISEITFEKMDENEAEKEETKVNDDNKEKEDVFEEEDYLMDEEEAETQAKFNKNYCFDKIEDKDFPLFLTIKRIVLMIDGTLQKPFFARKKDNSIIGSDTQAQWHNEVKGLMMISDKYRGNTEEEDDDVEIASPVDKKIGIQEKNNMIQEEEEEEDDEEETRLMKIDDSDIEAEYERYQAILKKRKDQLEHEQEMRKKNKMSFEVDYDYFYNHFWLRLYSRQHKVSKVSPILVWSEIISTIKGSAESHLYPGFYLPLEVYLSMAVEGSTLLNAENRRTIYKHFIDYEEWKMKESGYDFMDVVNHGLNEIRLKGYNGVPIHFIMIDEVQDLSHATILLLMKITEQSVFFAGDTAQTIAKGVGVRFSDLSSLFKLTPEKEYLWKRPTVHQLTVNFRSHSRILDMANSIVTLIETFFPKTIDRLKKEKSEIDGPKPILLEDVDLEVLFAVLFGTENFKSHRHSQNQGGALEKPPIEFGCNQAIIVRDQESKNKLPPLLKHALCLTVYEAKGLEFDDVILYNFFSESSVTQKEWELLAYLDIESKTLDKDTFDRYYFTYKEEELSDLNIEHTRKNLEGQKDKDELDLYAPDLFNFELDANKYHLKKVSLPKRLYSIIDLESYGTLCNELKQLYVALTRPRNRIIIYDDNVEKREEIEKYWKQLSLVQVINKKALESKKADPSGDEDLESFKSLLVSTSKSEWKKQGLRMFRNKYYEQAVKCFEKAEDEKLMRRAQGYLIAERASNKLKKISNEQNILTKEMNKAKEAEVKEKRTQTKQLRREAKTCYEDYEKAAVIFYELDLLKQASQCFFSAGNYQRALEIYEKLGMLREAGEACLMLKLYEKAADLFSRGGDIIRTIECLELIHDYDKILDILQNSKELAAEQRKYFGRKYVPLALLKLTEDIQFKEHEKVPEDNAGIPEDSQEEEEEEKEKTNEHETEIKDHTEEKLDIQKNVSNMSFDVIDKPSQEKEASFVEIKSTEIQRNLSNMSFENIEEPVESFDHLSQFDLKDEFLKSESGSILDSISAHRKDKSMSSSDFSAVEYNYLMNAQYQLVQTKADIFIQDSIMEKIIKYIDMFSDDFKENFQKLRSKGVLLSQDAEGDNKTANVHAMSHNLIDLDNISLDFVYLILDFLEQSKLFKLCIFVCNRYKLANKLGRYLVNMAFKYSNLPSDDMRANFFKLFLPRNRQIQQEKAFLANTAVHHILEIINPNYLKLKKKGEHVDDTNSLGDNCYSSLVSLGFWKKCLFLMDYKNSLALASTFASFKNYKLIFLTSSDTYNIPQDKIQALVEDDGFDFLPFEAPKSSQEVKAAIAGLESVVWELTEKLPTHLYKQYRPEIRNMRQMIVPKFPSYFGYNAALWDFLVNRKREDLVERIQSAPKSLDRLLKSQASYMTKVEMFDIVSFLVQVSLFYSSNQTVTDLINKLDISDVVNLVFALKQIVEYSLSMHSINGHQEIIMKALLSPLRIRFIERSSVLKEISLHNYIVHISSPIMADIVAAENSTSPGVIYDIEGNFILVSINLCLKEIRKKMTAIFKHFVNVQAKLHHRSYSSQESLKGHLEIKSYILGLIHAYNYCEGSSQASSQAYARKKSEPKKTNETNKPKGKQDKIDLEQERLDLEEEAYVELIGNSFKENRIKLGNSMKSQVVQQHKVNTKKEDDESITSFHLLKASIFKELKNLLAAYVDFKLDIGYYSRSELLNFGLRKLNKYVQQKKLKTWIVHLFYLIDSRVILNEFLRKHKKNPIAEKLQYYSDAIYYRKFFCSEEYADNTFQYISLSYNKMSLTDAIAVLESLVPYVIIADGLAQSQTQVALSPSLLASLGFDVAKETEKVWKATIVPLADREYLGEIFHWIAKVVDRVAREGLSNQICLRVLKLLLNIFANAQDLDGDTIRTLTGAVELLLDANPFQDYISDARSKRKNTQEESDEMKNHFLQNVLNAFHELDILDDNGLEGLAGFYKVQGFVTVTIESSAEKAQLNGEASEKAWLLDSRTIAQRITLRRKLKRLFLKKRANKLRENAQQLSTSQKTNYLLELIDASGLSTVKELKKYLLLPDLKLDIFDYVNDSVRQVLTYYGKNTLQSPIDFHYISNLIQKMVGCGLEYVKILTEGLKSKENRKKIDFQETHREMIEKVETMIREFEKWCQSKESQDKGEEKFAKRKKLVSAKWEEEALLIKMQQIAKKRKGLRKQIIQTKGKMRAETFKKKVDAERMQAVLLKKARGYKGTV